LAKVKGIEPRRRGGRKGKPVSINIKELERRIDEILYHVWDPIGVSDEPEARSEYSTYVPVLLRLVIESDEVRPISDYLEKIAGENMGLTPDKTHCDHVAELLLKHKKAESARS
jgi:hypothetical protein